MLPFNYILLVIVYEQDQNFKSWSPKLSWRIEYLKKCIFPLICSMDTVLLTNNDAFNDAHSNSDVRKRFFSIRVINMWNSLSADTVSSSIVVVGQIVDRQNVDRHNVEQTKCRTGKMSTDKMPNRQNVDNFFLFFFFFFFWNFFFKK